MNFTNTEMPKVDFDCSDEDLKFLHFTCCQCRIIIYNRNLRINGC